MIKGLEALQIIKGTCLHLRLLSTGEENAFKTIEKDLKALEIIKEKCYLHFTDNITDEEYDLLKEVLL